MRQEVSAVPRIAQVRKDHTGAITAVMLDNGQVLSMAEAVFAAHTGMLEDAEVTMKAGRRRLRTDEPLDALPEF